MTTPFSRRRFLAACAAMPMAASPLRADGPLRVVALDWALAETMIALGHPPVAIVAASDWKRFVVEPSLPVSVVDLGLQPEINFELLASLVPDLILTSPFVQEIEPDVGRIAETLRLSIFEPGPVPLEQPRRLMLTLGGRLGRETEAERYLAAADRLFEIYEERLRARPPRPVLLVTFVDARHVRVYGGAGLYQNVLDRIGVRNAWTRETNYWGYATIGIERLATDDDVQMVAFEPIPPDARPTLDRSPLWAQLPFVRAGRITVLPSVLMFGAMPAALRFARLLVDALAPPER